MAKEHFDVVIPLINRSCRLGTKVPIPLATDATVHTVRAADLATISARIPSSWDVLTGRSTVILWAGLASAPNSEMVSAFLLPAAFSLNFLSGPTAASIDRAYVLRTARKQHYHATIEIGGYNHNSASDFAIANGSDFSQVPVLFKGAREAIQKDPSMRISMSRFCGAVAKPHVTDKIIDVCICLESIFNASSEIKFRFSLYNTLLSKTEVSERNDVFKMLKKLYDLRSKIVHGSSEGDEVWLTDNWDKIVKIAKLSLIQKIEFLQTGSRDRWQEHLDLMSLGAA